MEAGTRALRGNGEVCCWEEAWSPGRGWGGRGDSKPARQVHEGPGWRPPGEPGWLACCPGKREPRGHLAPCGAICWSLKMNLGHQDGRRGSGEAPGPGTYAPALDRAACGSAPHSGRVGVLALAPPGCHAGPGIPVGVHPEAKPQPGQETIQRLPARGHGPRPSLCTGGGCGPWTPGPVLPPKSCTPPLDFLVTMTLSCLRAPPGRNAC